MFGFYQCNTRLPDRSHWRTERIETHLFVSTANIVANTCLDLINMLSKTFTPCRYPTTEGAGLCGSPIFHAPRDPPRDVFKPVPPEPVIIFLKSFPPRLPRAHFYPRPARTRVLERVQSTRPPRLLCDGAPPVPVCPESL